MAQAACREMERCLKEILIITGEVEGWGYEGGYEVPSRC